MTGKDWILEKRENDRTVLVVRQRRFELMRNATLAILTATVLWFIASLMIGSDNNDVGTSVFSFLIFALGGIVGFVGVAAALISLFVALATKSKVEIAVTSNGIELPKRNLFCSFDEIGSLYLEKSNKDYLETDQFHYMGFTPVGASIAAAANAGASANQVMVAIASLIAGANATVGVNHLGKQKVFAKRLSDDEACYLYERILAVTKS